MRLVAYCAVDVKYFSGIELEPGEVFTCGICSYKAYDADVYADHLNDVHLRATSFDC